jgi:hypothetical protein
VEVIAMGFSEKIIRWIQGQEYCLWESYDLPDYEVAPYNSVHYRDRILPRKPDGFTFGNKEVFGAVGCIVENSVIDVSAINVICGPNKAYTPIHWRNGGSVEFQIEYGIRAESNRLPLREFHHKQQRRVRNSAIIVSRLIDSDIEVGIVDFAPRGPDLPVIVRLVVIENRTAVGISDLALEVLVSQTGEIWTIGEVLPDSLLLANDGYKWEQPYQFDGPFLGLHVDRPEEETIAEGEGNLRYVGTTYQEGKQIVAAAIHFGGVGPFESRAAVLYLIPAETRDGFREVVGKLAGVDALEALDRTHTAWVQWSKEVTAEASDRKLEDYINSLQCILKNQEGKEAIHVGTVRHVHSLINTRDNYWTQRGLLKAGRFAEARKNLELFWRAWQRCGIVGNYDAQRKVAFTLRTVEERVEMPACFLLMLRDVFAATGDESLLERMWPMVEDAANTQLVTEEDLLIANGDETWLWAVMINELDSVVDNSFLAVPALEFAAEVAERRGSAEKARAWRELASRIRGATKRLMFLPAEERYAAARDSDGILDETPMTNPLSRPPIVGYAPARAEEIYQGLMDCWRLLRVGDIVRAHSRTSMLNGNTLGYFLHAVADLDVPFASDFVRGILDFSDTTGCLWEFHDIYNDDPVWMAQKRTCWDSAVALEGLLHYLFGAEPIEEGIQIAPHCPDFCDHVSTSGLRLKGHDLSIRITPTETVVEDRDRLVFKIDKRVRVTMEGNKLRIEPQLPAPPLEMPSAPLEIDLSTNSFNVTPVWRVYSLELDKMRVEQTIERNVVTVATENKTDGDLVMSVAGEACHLSARGTKVLYMNLPSKEAGIRAEVTDVKYTPLETIDPRDHKRFRVVGYARDGFGVPQEKVVVVWGNREQEVEVGEGGWFSTVLNGLEKGEGVMVIRSLGGEAKWSKEVHFREEFLGHITQFVEKDRRANCVIAYAGDCYRQAAEIARDILFHRQVYVHIKKAAKLSEDERRGNLIFIGEKASGEEIYSRENYRVTINPLNVESRLVYIESSGHVYEDVNAFLQDFRKNVTAIRVNANGYPEARANFADYYGDKPDDDFEVHVMVNNELNIYCFDREVDEDFRLPVSEDRDWVDRILGGKLFKKPYVGLAAFRAPGPNFGGPLKDNVLRIIVHGDADKATQADIEITLPQEYEPMQQRGLQWERVLDRVKLHRLPDGQKKLIINLHPGRPVHSIAEEGKLIKITSDGLGGIQKVLPEIMPPTRRFLNFTFIKYGSRKVLSSS